MGNLASCLCSDTCSTGGRLEQVAEQPDQAETRPAPSAAANAAEASVPPPAAVAPAPTAASILSAGVAAAVAAGLDEEAEQGSCSALYGLAPRDSVIPHNEAQRLSALRSLGVISQPTGAQFGSISSLLKLVFEVPIAQIFLIEEDQLWGVPNSGEEPWAAYPRCTSHCRFIFEPVNHELLIVEDMVEDARFKESVWVLGAPHIRFYASAPLVSTDGGHRYGTLCVADLQPRHFSAQQYQMLSHLSEVAVRELEGAAFGHFKQLVLEQARSSVRRLVRGLDCFAEGIMLLDVSEGFAIKYVNTAWTRLTGLTQQHASGTTFWDLFGNVAPGGGASQAEVQEAVRSRRPFTVTCGLLPMAMAESTCFSGRAAAAAGPGQLSSSRLAGAAFSSSSGGSGEGVFSATFTPASAPEFRPDEQFLGIPVVVPAAGAAGASGDPSRSLWFATLQQRPSPPPSAPTGSSVSSTVGSPAYGCASTAAFSSCSMEHLRPRNMQGATLGPLLGAGANGRAYRGVWQNSEVCIKVLNITTPLSAAAAGDGGGGAAPLLEAVLTSALRHPNIVPTYAWGVSEGAVNALGQHESQVWIVQTLCTLGTLAHARDRGLFMDTATQGPDLRTVLLTMRDVAAALAYLHGLAVLHGDLSSYNVLLNPSSLDERGFTAMVADFGLSRPSWMAGSDSLPRGACGTAAYMPMELLTRDELSPAVDTFAAGVVFWELMQGRRAWRGMGPMQIIAAVTVQQQVLSIPSHWPQPIQALVRSCLSHDPGDRPTAPQLLDQLTSMLAEEQRGGALNGGLDGGRGGGGMDGNGTVGGSTGEQ